MFLSTTALAAYGLAAFTGNTIWSATGFGHAIFYLLVYQIADFMGFMVTSTLKYTILLQTVALMPSLIFVYSTNFKNIWSHFHWKIVVPMLVPEASLVYFGQYVQKFTDESKIRLIIGGFVLIVASLKIFQNCYLSGFGQKKEAPEEENTEDLENSKLTKNEKQTQNSVQTEPTEDNTEIVYPKFMLIWVILVGCCAGFLGGLIGASGPPLIIFFLFFSFPKGIVRTTGFACTTNNLIARIVSYLLTEPPQDGDYWSMHNSEADNHGSWFLLEDWVLYSGIAVFSVLGTVVGSQFHKRLTPGSLDNILIFMLVVCALLMLAKGVVG